MKPDGPADSRGEFRPLATTVPGVQYCEYLPRLARLAHRTTLIRSMNHGVNQAHALAVYTALTGHDRGDTNAIVGNSLEDHPCPGAVVTTVSWAPDANATWDTHSGNFKKLKGTLLPQFDAAAGSLIRDLAERGLLERTIVAVLGDIGRTPKINGSDAGRDHWNWCYSVLLAGGGLRPGYVHGASDRTGAFPAREPTSPGDLISTLYHLLGIDPHGELTDLFGRPHRIIPHGEVLRGLIA